MRVDPWGLEYGTNETRGYGMADNVGNFGGNERDERPNRHGMTPIEYRLSQNRPFNKARAYGRANPWGGKTTLVAPATSIVLTVDGAAFVELLRRYLPRTARALPVAGGAAAADGPILAGDIIAVLVLAAAVASDLADVNAASSTATASNGGNHTVRLQAQGGGLEQSVVIESPTPITVAQGITGLTELRGQLSTRELVQREALFQRAERFIRSGPAGGGIIPPGKSFSLPRSDIRVDVEILRGQNFRE